MRLISLFQAGSDCVDCGKRFGQEWKNSERGGVYSFPRFSLPRTPLSEHLEKAFKKIRPEVDFPVMQNFGSARFDFRRSASPSAWSPYPEREGGYYWEFLVGVCRSVLQILTLFQTKKYNFPHPFSDQTFKIHTRFQTWRPLA